MQLLNEEQEVKLKEITSELHYSREAKSISIEDVAIKTLIRPAFLQAIEAGKFEDLPEPVYVQGFIRRYADAIGLDGVAIAQSFADVAMPPQPSPEINASELKPGIDLSQVAPYVVFVFLLAGSIFGLVNLLNQGGAKTASETKATVSKAQTNPAPVTSTPIPKPAPQGTLPEKVTVSIDLQDKSWMRIITDGNKVYEGTLSKGDQKTFTAKEQLVIRAGNAGAVSVSVNNQPAKLLGSAGKIEEVTYTRKSLPQ